MSIIRQYNLKRLSSKWVFSLVLMLSFFAFTGFGPQSQIKPDKPQTTLVVNSGIKLKKTISYHSALVKAPVTSAVFDFINLSRLHSCLVKIRFTTLSKTPVPLQTALFYRAKITSENSGDEPATILG